MEAVGARDLRVRLSSLGTPETREAYLAELGAYLREHESELSEDVRDRLDSNPLRAFDADHAGTRAVMEGAPRLLDRLGADDAEHFAAVRALLDDAGLSYEVDTTLVRGLDYYTRTVFEVESGALGAQNALGGGGRYDRLVERLGGPRHPGRGLRGRGRADPAGRRGRRRARRRRRVRGRGRPRRGALRLRARAAAARARPDACRSSRPGAPSRAS